MPVVDRQRRNAARDGVEEASWHSGAVDDLKGEALRGGLAKAVAQGTNFVLRLACLITLARILEPTDFGLVGMVTAITGALGLFKEFGLSVATVQRDKVTEEQISALFWVNLAVGLILALTSVVIAPFVAAFYDDQRLSLIMTALGLGFVFNAAGVQHAAILQRQIRFTTLAVIDVASLLISSTVSIVLAVAGFGYWALVAWSVTLPLVATTLAWQQSGWRPGAPRRRSAVGSLLRFGGVQTVNSVVIYAAYNLDKILVGRYWGAEALGIYGRAYQLVTIPTEQINATFGSIAIPVLSRLQNDPQRLKSYFLKSYTLVLALTIPVTVACLLFAEELISILLGPKWADAVPVFRRLAPAIFALALISPTGWFLVSVGMVGRSLKLAMALAPIAITGYAIGLQYGPTGVALGFSCAMMLWLVPHLLWSFHGTVITIRDLAHVTFKPLVSGAVSASCALAVLHVYGPSGSAVNTVAVGGTVLAAVYLATLLFVMDQKAFYVELLRGLRTRAGT
jgi:PST family polysaccharide transporter